MRAPLVLALVVLAGVVPLYGHHSFAAYYHEDKSVSIEGELVEFEYRNPHAWVYILAPDERGQMQRYGAEWGNPGRLSRQGITKETLKAGDRLIVTGSPSRNPADFKLHLKGVQRPADGWKWAGGRR